MIKRRSVFERK